MNPYREVKHPRTRHIGDRVIGLRYVPNPKYLGDSWTNGEVTYKFVATREFPGTLIKNEYSYGLAVVTNPRYTVKCDDGKVRRFQVLKSK